MRIAFIALCAAGATVSTSSADFLGYTSTTRSVAGGTLVNIFAVTNNSGDQILNISAGALNAGNTYLISTNSAGGFRQGPPGAEEGEPGQSLFAPSGSQSWTTLDSFLTIGGSTVAGTGGVTNWRANGNTVGDPNWNSGGFNAFGNPTDSSWTNPYTSAVAPNGGWFASPTTASNAISLSSIASVRNQYALVDGIRYNATNQAAAEGAFGFMVAQFYVSEFGGTGDNAKFIDWRMGVTLKLPGVTSSVFYATQVTMRIGEFVPAPGAMALLGLAGLASRRRRA